MQMADAQNIVEALKHLDAENDEHWTSEGKPRVDAVVAALAELDPLSDGEVKRKDIESAVPGFDRSTAAPADENDDDENQTPAVENKDAEAPLTENQPGVEPADVEAKRAEYTQRLNELAENLADANAHLEQVRLAVKAIQDEIEKVDDAMKAEVGPIPFAVAHRAYVAQQIRLRMARAGKVSAINDFAGQNTGLSHKAPIDQAMARNRNRGSQRPLRAPLGR